MFDLCRTVSFLTLLESSPSLVEVWWLSTTLHSEMLMGNPRALLSIWVCDVFISKKISLCCFLPPCVPSCSVPQWFPCSSQTLWELFLIHVSAELKEKNPQPCCSFFHPLIPHTSVEELLWAMPRVQSCVFNSEQTRENGHPVEFTAQWGPGWEASQQNHPCRWCCCL